MKAAFYRSRAGLVALGCSALVGLAGCSEREVILPGVREDIRPNQADALEVENRSQAIRLSSQSRNASWPQSPGMPVYRTDNAALSAAPRLLWSTSIGEGDGRRQRITASPVVGGGLIYTLDASSTISAVSPSGQRVWQATILPPQDGDGEATGGGIAFHKGTLYVSSGFGVLTAFDAKSGAQRWRQELEATGSGTPTVVDNFVYLIAGDDTGWAINADNGRILWQVTATPSAANVLGAPAPVVASELAVFSFGSGDVVATFKRGGLRRWDASVSGRRIGSASARILDVTGSPMIVGNKIVTGNHSGRTVAMDSVTGQRIWTQHEGALGPLWPAGDSLFSVTDTNYLARLAQSDGEVIWKVELPGFVKNKPRKRSEIVAHYGPIVAGGQVVLASNDGLLRFFKPEDGSLVRSIEVPDGATTAPVVAGGTLYVVSTKGELHAFR
ncbi:PQQ-binding-like beta-propeller repeat protein [Aliisedimentitalea scapharcae]|uniref:PQQ-binding-like beta-propeller repeat protein n=1 Tax=Aliisedimentitalea scapharcae TaxID=1524259 RepID=A0ABZ2Y1A8_9RHOB|nr:PQQ-like beta-propeller repeat protein [Rhodobacteraceae bacterium M382]